MVKTGATAGQYSIIGLALPFTHKLTYENSSQKIVNTLRTYLANNHNRATSFGGPVADHFYDQDSLPS